MWNKNVCFRIDMYVEGTTDLMGMIMYLPFQPADTKEKNLALIIERATTRYFPVYEKVSDKSTVVHKDSKVVQVPPHSTPLAPRTYFPEGKLQYNSGTVWWSQHSAKWKEGHKIIFSWFQYWVSLLFSLKGLLKEQILLFKPSLVSDSS